MELSREEEAKVNELLQEKKKIEVARCPFCRELVVLQPFTRALLRHMIDHAPEASQKYWQYLKYAKQTGECPICHQKLPKGGEAHLLRRHMGEFLPDIVAAAARGGVDLERIAIRLYRVTSKGVKVRERPYWSDIELAEIRRLKEGGAGEMEERMEEREARQEERQENITVTGDERTTMTQEIPEDLPPREPPRELQGGGNAEGEREPAEVPGEQKAKEVPGQGERVEVPEVPREPPGDEAERYEYRGPSMRMIRLPLSQYLAQRVVPLSRAAVRREERHEEKPAEEVPALEEKKAKKAGRKNILVALAALGIVGLAIYKFVLPRLKARAKTGPVATPPPGQEATPPVGEYQIPTPIQVQPAPGAGRGEPEISGPGRELWSQGVERTDNGRYRSRKYAHLDIKFGPE